MRHALVLDRIRRIAGIAAIGVACGCAGDRVPEWCTVPEGAAPRVAGEPAGWTSPPALREAWRVDGSTPGQELVMPVATAISSATGRIALADFGLHEVVVIGPEGKWIGRWGKSGSGPGELRAPYAVAWRPDGRLVVYDPAQSKLVVFDSAGTAIQDTRVEPAFTAALGGGGRIDLDGSGLLLGHPGPAFRGEGEMRAHVVVLGGPMGEPVDTVAASAAPVIMPPGVGPITLPGWATPLAAIHGDSILAVTGENAEYVIDVYRGGAVSHTICRAVDPLPFEAEEKEPHQSNIPEVVTTAMTQAEPPETPAPIGRLTIDNERRLWVQRDRPRALAALDEPIGRPGSRFDVYDVDGEYLGEVVLPENVRFVGATRELIIGLETNEQDVLSVVALEPDW